MSGMIAGITATPMRRCGFVAHEVGEPAVVGAAPGDRLLDVVGRAREPGPERRRRDASGAEHVGVREQHLGDDAFFVEHRVARGGVEGGGEAAVAAGLLFPLGWNSDGVVRPIASREVPPWPAGARRSARGTPGRGTPGRPRPADRRGRRRRSRRIWSCIDPLKYFSNRTREYLPEAALGQSSPNSCQQRRYR